MHLTHSEREGEQLLPVVVVGALGFVALTASAISIIGSDALWMPALGDRIRQEGRLPPGIPFATAFSGTWVNTTAIGQLILSVIHEVGSIGLVVANVVVVVIAMTVLALDARLRGARPTATALTLLVVAAGASASLFITRAQLLSLVPFALLVILVRRQADHPSAGIWWSVPLIAIWSNVHGAVLVGVAVLGCYLLFSRLALAPVTAVAVGVCSLLATCLNPGLLQAPHYYVGVLSGHATTDPSGMWGRLSLTNPFDILLVLAALALGAATLRRRQAVWEYAAALGLLLATLSAARHGLWLLLFLAVPAALTSAVRHDVRGAMRRRRMRPASAVVAVVLMLVSAVVLATRAPLFRLQDSDAAGIADVTHGHVVLAPEPLVESLAAAGATVWASNPLDAFDSADQTAYLAFLRGDEAGAKRALDAADVIVAQAGTAQWRMAVAGGYRQLRQVGQLSVFLRG